MYECTIEPNEEIFNFENKEIYDIGTVFDWLIKDRNSVKTVNMPLYKLHEQFNRSIIEGNISLDKMKSLTPSQMSMPLIIAQYQNGTVRLVDGHHRGARLAYEGIPSCRAWVLTKEQTAIIYKPYSEWLKSFNKRLSQQHQS